MSNPNPLTYNGWITSVAVLAVEPVITVSGVVQFLSAQLQAIVPSILDYAELRIQRDLDLNQLLTSGNYTFTSGNNVLSIPNSNFVAVQTMSVNGVPLIPVSKEFLQNVYGVNATASAPQYFAPYGGDSAGGNTSTNFLVGPFPDANYPVSVTGYVRAPSLYANATPSLAGSASTFISSQLPDLLLQASMIPVAEFQRSFGATSSDPQQGFSYEQVYEGLLKGAIVEEARKKFSASAWSAMAPALVASPTR